jgi:hypothetical protein
MPSPLAPARSRAPGPRPATPPAPPAVDAARPWRLLVVGCLALAALSLLIMRQPTYDPWAWLIWGRQIAHLDLVTTAGPSWKPLPVLFTTPFSLFGDGAAPLLWLVVARAGGLLAFALAFRVAARLAGPAAGVIALVALLLADRFVSFFARGNSEGLLVALSLWAVERHIDGRRRDAFLLGIAAGLIRPEVWVPVGLYGLWLVVSDRHSPRFRGTAAMVGGGLALLAVLWFVPEYIGSGDFLRAASRAREPVPDSPAQAAVPFLAVFTNGASALTAPVYAGAVIAVLLALRAYRDEHHGTGRLTLAALATFLMLTVAALAQAGFTGNLRYVLLPAAFVCVLAGVGWVQLVEWVRGRRGARAAWAAAAVAAAAGAPFVIAYADRLSDQLRGVRAEARVSGALPAAIARAGGPAAVLRCGQVFTDPFQTQLVAWHLHVAQHEVGIFPRPPGTTVAPAGSTLARDRRFPPVTSTRYWSIGSSCPRGGG